MKQLFDNLQSLLNSKELQDYLTDYLNCDRVKLILMKEGRGFYTLSVTVIDVFSDIYCDVENVAYSATYESTFTKHGHITNLLHRFSEEHGGSRTFDVAVLGDKLTKYLNDRLPDESSLSEYDLNTLDRRTLYPKTMIRKEY